MSGNLQHVNGSGNNVQASVCFSWLCISNLINQGGLHGVVWRQLPSHLQGWQLLSLCGEAYLLKWFLHRSSCVTVSQWHFLDLAWPSSFHSVLVWAQIIMLCSAFVEDLDPTCCGLESISCTYTMGGLILSSSGPNLDKQSASWLVDAFMYFTLKSYGKVLINKCCSLGVACVRLLARTFSNGFWFVSSWNIFPSRKWWNFSRAQETANDSGSVTIYVFFCGCRLLLAK